jgi:iron complex outermembrane recepter protein
MKRICFAATLSALLLLCIANAFGQVPGSSPDPLETIIVSGSKTADTTEISLMPGGASLIDIEDLRERNVGSLADVLRYVPGVWSVSDTGNDEIFFSSRGSNLDATDWDMNGIKLLQDGLPVTTADGNNHNRVIDPLAARYATVARGANALSYGASTLGGAINFVTPTARDAAGVDLALNAGSHGQVLGRLSLGKVLSESFDGLLTVEAKRWDGYREHNAQDRAGFYANAGWLISDKVVTRFFATYLENDQELPGSLSRDEHDTNPDQASRDAVDGDYQLDVDTWRLANRTSWQIDENRRLDFGLSIEEQQLFHPIVWVAIDFDGPGPQLETEVFSLLVDTDHRDVGTMLRYNQRIGDHDLLFGLNYGHNDTGGGDYRNLHGRPNGLTTLVNNDATTTEVFAMDRWRLDDRTTLILSAQAVSAEREIRNTDAASGALANPKGTYTAINPRFGVIHAVGASTTLYGNVSSLFEAPTNFELEDNVAGGNATLDAMEGTVVEIGTRGEREFASAGRWTWDVSFYYAEIDDEILSVEDPNAPGTSLVTNIDHTTHAGVEAVINSVSSLGGNGRRSIEPLVSLTLNDFAFDGDPTYGDNDLPAAPEYFVRGEVMYRSRSGFHIGPTIDLVGDRWADFSNTYRIDSHTVLGLRGGWTGERWRAYAELRNLEDEKYVASHSVRNIAGPADRILNPGEPRSAYFGVQVQLE